MCSCTVFALFYFEFRALSEYKSLEVCISRGDLSEGFLRYEFGGDYIGRGSYMEGLISGILRYVVTSRLSTEQRATLYVRRCKKILIR